MSKDAYNAGGRCWSLLTCNDTPQTLNNYSEMIRSNALVSAAIQISGAPKVSNNLFSIAPKKVRKTRTRPLGFCQGISSKMFYWNFQVFYFQPKTVQEFRSRGQKYLNNYIWSDRIFRMFFFYRFVFWGAAAAAYDGQCRRAPIRFFKTRNDPLQPFKQVYRNHPIRCFSLNCDPNLKRP